MNRAFPPETTKSCDNCGRDIVVVETPEGGLEANDVRDYVWADPGSDPRDHVFICAGCRVSMGVED